MLTGMFYKENEMKDTSIGKVPHDWTVATLNSLVRLIMGQSPPSSTYNKEGVGLPFLQGKMEFGDIHPHPMVYCSNPLKVAEQNDVLMSVRAPVGDVNLAPYRLCIGRGLAAIRFDEKVANHMFYFYVLQRIKSSIERIGKGSTFKALVKGDLESLNVVLPPRQEQQQIAEILSTADKAIQKTNEIIVKTERLKKGLMQQLLTRGIGHKEFKDTEIGRIPKDWELVRLGDRITLQRGYDLPDKQRKNGQIPVIGSNGIVGYHNTCMAKGPGVVIGRSGTLGKVYYSETNYWPLNTSLFVKKFTSCHPRFVYYMFQNFDFKQFSAGTSVPTLNRNLVHPTKVAFPRSLDEQLKIAEILSTVDKKLELERKEKTKLEKAKQGLMYLLLMGKIRIKVD